MDRRAQETRVGRFPRALKWSLALFFTIVAIAYICLRLIADAQLRQVVPAGSRAEFLRIMHEKRRIPQEWSKERTYQQVE